ncbi:hypothetical protein L484_012940 [Morus notabilis]|uniref:Uncharacterized protein n=1 Tax=Morus notabilis TaxID=981085 RepID=W9SQJ4_9ROSA|nr:hypothetical protein L484_012940 [Morus notabilis]
MLHGTDADWTGCVARSLAGRSRQPINGILFASIKNEVTTTVVARARRENVISVRLALQRRWERSDDGEERSKEIAISLYDL